MKRSATFICILAAVGLVLAQVPPPGVRTPAPVSFGVRHELQTLKSMPNGAYFAFDAEPGAVYQMVYPRGGAPAGKPADSTVHYGIVYQPTPDANSVFAINVRDATLWRMQASLTARKLTNVRVSVDLSLQ